MVQSPIFAKTYDLLRWLVPRTTKFPREHRFGLAERIQEAGYRLQHHLICAAKEPAPARQAAYLRAADVDLSELRTLLRLSRDLGLLKAGGYEHGAEMMAEVGRLLGGWQKKVSSDK